MSNIKCQISNIQSRVDIRHWTLDIGHYFANQAGFGQLAVIALLIAGVAITTLVVQNRTNISPNAQGISRGECSGSWEFIGDKEDPSGASDNAGDDSQWLENSKNCTSGGNENNQSCQEEKWTDEVTSGESNCRDGKVCYKAWKRNSDCSISQEGWACTDRSCGGSTISNSDNSEEECKKVGGQWRDNRCFNASSSTGGASGPGNQASSGGDTQYDQGDCRDGAKIYKDGYTWIAYCNQVCQSNSDCAQNTSEGAVDPKTSNWCYGFNGGQAPRCMKLVQSDNKEVSDQSRQNTNNKAVQDIKNTLAQGGNPNPASQEAKQSSSAELRAKIEAQLKQRNDLTGEMASLLNAGGNSNSEIKAAIAKAQTLMTDAASKAVGCYTGNDKPLSDSCDAVAQAANDTAIAAARVALFDAVAAGYPNTCVKVDMAVGKNNSNTLIEVATKDDPSNVSRLFMCRGAESKSGSKDGEIKWRVRDNRGDLQEVSQSSLSQLGLSTGLRNASSIPVDFIARRNNAATLVGLPVYKNQSSGSNCAGGVCP